MYCCVSSRYIAHGCRTRRVSSSSTALPFDVEKSVTKPVVRFFTDHFLTSPEFDYSLQICESKKTDEAICGSNLIRMMTTPDMGYDHFLGCCSLDGGKTMCYSTVDPQRNITWGTARNKCTSIPGGDLVSIHSQEEFLCFSRTIDRKQRELRSQWISNIYISQWNAIIQDEKE